MRDRVRRTIAAARRCEPAPREACALHSVHRGMWQNLVRSGVVRAMDMEMEAIHRGSRAYIQRAVAMAHAYLSATQRPTFCASFANARRASKRLLSPLRGAADSNKLNGCRFSLILSLCVTFSSILRVHSMTSELEWSSFRESARIRAGLERAIAGLEFEREFKLQQARGLRRARSHRRCERETKRRCDGPQPIIVRVKRASGAQSK